MKALLVLLTVSSLSTFAQSACKTAYVSKAYNACIAMTDTSQPGVALGSINLQSEEMMGGADQIAVCQNLQDSYNLDSMNQAAGRIAVLNSPGPIAESSRKDWGIATYRYTCSLSVTQYPMVSMAHPSCGTTGAWALDANPNPDEAEVRCLSCDDYDDQSVESVVACLQKNIKEIVQPRAVAIRANDLEVMKAKVEQILELSKYKQVSNLQSLEEITLFVDFIK